MGKVRTHEREQDLTSGTSEAEVCRNETGPVDAGPLFKAIVGKTRILRGGRRRGRLSSPVLHGEKMPAGR